MAFVSVLVLFLGIAFNFWGIASQKWLAGFQKETESLVLGRILETRQSGPWSQGGLLGWILVDLDPRDYGYKWQYRAFAEGLPSHGYVPYLTHPGGQAFLLSMIDRAVSVPAAQRLALYTGLTALLSAAALAAIVVWFELTHGLTVSLFVLASMVFAQWLIAFGRNLFWSLWAFYLPLLAVSYWLHRHRSSPRASSLGLGGIVFLAVWAKCLFTGFEYLTTALLMIFVPVVYYSLVDSWGRARTLRTATILAAAAALGVLLSAGLLVVQIQAVEGTLVDGIEHIVFSLRKRSFGNPAGLPPEYAPSLQDPLLGVLLEYFKGRFVDLNLLWPAPHPFLARYVFKVRYAYLMGAFLLASVLLWRGARAAPRRPRIALLATTWFAILPPLSWFILFKAHSSIHTHLNYIVWQMPFTFFGFAMIGWVARDSFVRVRALPAWLRARRLRADTPAPGN